MANNFYLSQQLAIALTQRQLRLAVAESCTGGGLAYQLTTVPGSAQWFEQGVIPYSNTAKVELLGVNPRILEQHGAVSAETAEEMSKCLIKQCNTDISLSITGVAGPGGGSPQKPVGMVYFGLAERSGFCQSRLKYFTSGRAQIRKNSITFALCWLLEHLSAFNLEEIKHECK